MASSSSARQGEDKEGDFLSAYESEAIELVEKAIQIKPNEYFYETLFQAYIRNCSYEKIIYYENNVKSLYPKNFSLLFNIALAYKNLKQFSKAIQTYETALKINPSSYQGWFNLAHLYEIKGQGKNAVSAMKICNKLKPNDKDTEYFYSTSLMRIKNYDKGLKLFEQRQCRELAIASQAKTYPNLASKDRLWRGENIKNKTKGILYILQYVRFWNYFGLLQRENEQLKDRWNKLKSILIKQVDEWECVDDDLFQSQVNEDKTILLVMKELEKSDSNE